MKSRIFIISITALLLTWTMALTAQAALIDFSEVALLTSNPTIKGTSFWAGDPGAFNDTYTNNAWAPGSPYMANGRSDSSVVTPSPMDTFIGVSLVPNTVSVGFDILSEDQLPGGTNLTLLAYLNGVLKGSSSLFIGDNVYHQMSLNVGTAIDTLYIFDDVNSFGLGEAFHITNFNGAVGGSNTVPEPSTIILFLTGLAGAFIWRRNRNP